MASEREGVVDSTLAELNAPLDCDGERLAPGDRVVSTRDYGESGITGMVVEVFAKNLIFVRYDRVRPGASKAETWRSAAFLWKKARDV